MALQLTKAHAKQAFEKYEHLKRRVSNMRQKAEETTKKVVRTAEVGAAAFGMGLLQGRTQGVEILGVPLELGAGLVLNVLGMMDAAGGHSEHLTNLGDGCVAAYAATLGRGVGVTMREKSGSMNQSASLPGIANAGLAAAVKGTHLSPEELESLAAIPA